MNMSISAENSARIRAIGVIATFLVIALHTCSHCAPWSVSWYLKESFEHGICRMAVPFFFAVSGFFMAAHCSEPGWWKRCVVKRLKTVGVPYLFWSFFEWLFVFGLVVSANVIGHRPFLQNADCSLWTIVKYVGLDLTQYPGYGIFWYLRTLILMAVLSPITFFIVRRTKLLLPILMFALNLYVFSLGDQTTLQKHVLVLDLEGVTYFVIGVYIALCKPVLTLKHYQGFLCMVIAGILSAAYPYLFAHGLPNEVIGTLVIPLLMLGLWFELSPVVSFPAWLTRNTFAVYILHPFVGTILKKAHCNLVGIGFVGFLVQVLIVMLLSVVVVESLRKFVPRFAKIVFGGR